MKAVADLETFLNALPPCVLVDGRGQVVTANLHAAQLLGYGRAGMIGMAVDAFVPEASAAAHRAFRAAWSAAPLAGPMGVELADAIKRGDAAGPRFDPASQGQTAEFAIRMKKGMRFGIRVGGLEVGIEAAA